MPRPSERPWHWPRRSSSSACWSPPPAADIGWSLVPLQELHGDAASRALAAAGVTVRTRSKVREVVPTGDGWTVDGEAFDDVVLAVPPSAAEALAPARAVELESGWAEELGSTPIVNLHVIYDRVVLDEPFVAAVDSPLQWVFDRTHQAGLDRGPVHRGVAVGGGRPRSTHRSPSCVTACCRTWSGCCGSPPIRACWSSSSPGSGKPPSGSGRAPPACVHQRVRRCPVSTWPVRGPIPAGPQPWRAPSAAERPQWPRCSNGAPLTTPGGSGMTITAETLDRSRGLVAPALRQAVERLDPFTRLVVSYHLGWSDEHGTPTDANPGKTLRPALALLAAEAVTRQSRTGVAGRGRGRARPQLLLAARRSDGSRHRTPPSPDRVGGLGRRDRRTGGRCAPVPCPRGVDRGRFARTGKRPERRWRSRLGS